MNETREDKGRGLMKRDGGHGWLEKTPPDVPGPTGALIRLDSKVAELRRDWLTEVNCRRCSAVLMSASVLPPGSHELMCPVCGVKERVEVSGGTLATLAAVAGSALEEAAAAAARKRQEVINAIQQGKMHGPLVLLVPLIVPSLISAGIALGSSLLTRHLPPRSDKP